MVEKKVDSMVSLTVEMKVVKKVSIEAAMWDDNWVGQMVDEWDVYLVVM